MVKSAIKIQSEQDVLGMSLNHHRHASQQISG